MPMSPEERSRHIQRIPSRSRARILQFTISGGARGANVRYLDNAKSREGKNLITGGSSIVKEDGEANPFLEDAHVQEVVFVNESSNKVK